MKEIQLIIIVTIIVIAFSGCRKSSNNKSTNNTGGYIMKAYIDGNTFMSDSCKMHLTAISSNDTIYIITGGNWGLSGGKQDTPSMALYLFHYHGTGTYGSTSVGSLPSMQGLLDSNIGFNGVYTSKYGIATITSVSPTNVTGTFTFTATGGVGISTVMVSNGSFTAHIQ